VTRRFPVVIALAFQTQNCGVADLRHCRGVSSSKKCVRANLIVKGGFSAFVADSIGVWGVSGSKCLGFLGVSILLRAGCYCDDTGEIKSIHPLESKNLRVQLGFPCTTIGETLLVCGSTNPRDRSDSWPQTTSHLYFFENRISSQRIHR